MFLSVNIYMKKVLVNGGSYTTGLSPFELNWVNLLKKKVDINITSIATPGVSIKQVVRTTITHLSQNGDYDAVIIIPPIGPSRREFILPTTSDQYDFTSIMVSNIKNINTFDTTKKALMKFYESKISNEWEDYMDILYNLHYLLMFLETLPIPYYVISDEHIVHQNPLNNSTQDDRTDSVYENIKAFEQEINKYIDINNSFIKIIGKQNIDNYFHPTYKGYDMFADFIIENFLNKEI